MMGRFEIVRVNQIQFGMIIFYNVKISHKSVTPCDEHTPHKRLDTPSDLQLHAVRL